MKTIVFTCLSLIFCLNLYAQEVKSNNNLFVRVYDLNGNKIYKGKVLETTENLLVLKTTKGDMSIDIKKVGLIKTKRSAGHNILVGSTIAAFFGSFLGAASAEPDALILGYSAGEGAVMGAIVALPVGAAVGGLSALWKKSETYLINGDIMRWQEVKDVIILRNK